MDILIMLLAGALAGWIGSVVFSESGLGLFGNIVTGLVGSVIGYWFFEIIGVSLGTGLWPAILTGTLGSIIALSCINLLIGARSLH